MGEINHDRIKGTWRHCKTVYTPGKEHEIKRGTEYTFYPNGHMECYMYTDNSKIKDNTLHRWSLTTKEGNDIVKMLCFNESRRYEIMSSTDNELQVKDHYGIYYWKKT